MKNIIPLLSVAIMASAVITKPVATQPTASAEHAAGYTYTTHNLSPQYAQFALALQKQTSTVPIAKGAKKSSPTVHYASVIAPQSAATVLPVFNQADIKPRHQQIANDALTKLPQQCWDALENFYVRYDNPSSRGLAGATTMILDGNVPDDEFRALFMHEIGHVFDLNQNIDCLRGTIASGMSEFKDGSTPIYNDDPSVQFYRISWLNANTPKPGQTESNFVSGYAQTNIFEDFAESHTLFVLHNPEFRAMAQNNTALALKYNFFIQYMYPQGIQIADSDYIPEGKRVWDTTKLPYTWL